VPRAVFTWIYPLSQLEFRIIAFGTYYQGVIASDFKVSSKETYKTNIRPVTRSVLETVMGWDIKQYNLKTDIPKLYEMRMNRKEGEPTITTDAIPTHYGLVIPKESEESGVGLYGMSVFKLYCLISQPITVSNTLRV
ncbi:hypothetical protein ACT4US_36625, partial [Bacillus sp. HC-Mk]